MKPKRSASCLQAAEIIPRRHRALRIGRRGDVDRHRSRQRGFIERVEIGQESVGERGRQIDRLAARGTRAGAIGRIERIGHQDRRPALALADIARGGERREKQPFAAAVEHQKFGLGIDRARQLEPAGEPVCRRPPERLDALGDRIAAEFGDVFGQHRTDETPEPGAGVRLTIALSMACPADTAPAVRSAARMASARFPGCRRPAARGMKRSWPYLKRQHCWAADRISRPAGNGSDHHRYGEVKTRLTIGPGIEIRLPDSEERRGSSLR